ncbi:MAG: TetR/AcrR family transcriptional regulator [Spirochaetota bacterium]
MDKETNLREKKKLIIDALRRCLERDVYSNITVQQVADESGFSKGGLLHYFFSKEDMYHELVDTMCRDILAGQKQVLKGLSNASDQASLSALYSIEQFFLDKNNIHVFLNLLLYSFEDETVNKRFHMFFQDLSLFYRTLIDEKYEKIPSRRKTDLPSTLQARLLMITVMASGIFETVDPVNLDQNQLTRYILSFLKA